MRARILVGTLLASLFFISTTAQAFIIEPYYGIHMSGDFKDEDSTSDYSGNNLGLRLGMTTLGFMYGLQYEMGSKTVAGAAGETDTDLDATDLSLFFGFEFPILVRAWLAYDISADATASVTGTDIDFSGSGYTIGVGYTGFPFISLNLEMFSKTWDDCSVAGFTDCRTNVMAGSDFTANGMTLSISAPFSL